MNIRIYLFMLILLLFGTSCTKDSGANNTNPLIVESEIFTYILYDGLTQNILEPIQTKLDESYSKVLDDLEVDSINKVTVRIWNNEMNFLDNMQTSIGMTYPDSTGWVYNANDIRVLNRGNTAQTVLHEFCHAVSLVVNPQFGNNPRWFWEAVAIYKSGEFIHPQTISYLVSGDFPTLAELSTDYNASNHNIYEVGYLISEFIIENWGKTHYVNLIRSNGDIMQTLELTVQEFEDAWKVFVLAKYF